MGCDGGTIPKRDELVKTKKKPEQKDKAAELAFRWQNCALSQARLQPPVVACELGRLYNKETIIESLLDKSSEPEPATSSTSNGSSDMISHIKSLRDVKALNFTENPDWTEDATDDKGVKGDGYIDMQKSRWICPVSGQEMNGRFRFVFIWQCGCVLSEKALKEMNKTRKSDKLECLKCQKEFEMSDVILLNPIEAEEIALLQEKMEARRAKAKDLKKNKKKSKAEASSAQNDGTIGDNSASANVAKEVVSSASISSKLEKRKLEKNEQEGSKSNGPNGNGILSTKKSKVEASSSTNSVSKLNAYSVAKDPKASSTYKSLFTSSEKGKGQQRAHWVTYNPFYN